MAHSPDIKDGVRRVYIEGLALAQACQQFGVSYDTAREWKRTAKAKGDDWDSARVAYKVSDGGIDAISKSMIEDFSKHMSATLRGLENEELPALIKANALASIADSYSKFARTFGKVNPQFSGLSVAMDTFKTIIEYLKKNDNKALTALHPHLDELGGILGKKYG